MDDIKSKKKSIKKVKVAEEEIILDNKPIVPDNADILAQPEESIKRAYKVVIVKPNMVIFSLGNGQNAFTKNIWGMNLKVGDMIYL